MTDQNSKPSKSNEQQYIDVLEKAKKSDPENPFVESCESFFKKAGFLTLKQFAALDKIKPRKPSNSRKPFDNDDIDNTEDWGVGLGEEV